MTTNFPLTPRTPTEVEREYAAAMLLLVEAKVALATAVHNVPSYTGQYSPKDFYADEQDHYDEAVMRLADATRALIKEAG